MTTREAFSRTTELERMANSGWNLVPALADALGTDPHAELERKSDGWWGDAAAAASDLGRWVREKRFGDEVELGLLYVPHPTVLDTRARIPTTIRRAQLEELRDDVVDDRLDAGTDLVPAGRLGAFFLTCVGRYGVSVGSYERIASAPEDEFTADGVDLRRCMTRQLWGARVLQAGHHFLPDSDTNDTWTFTLFAGDRTVEDQAPSGTVLKSHVRFRLGKTNRGIGSARVAPAIPLP